MSSEVLEIVKLEDGGVALRKVNDTESEPVITVRFSDETLQSLQHQHLGVAQAMIAAGVQLIANARERLNEEDQPTEPTFH